MAQLVLIAAGSKRPENELGDVVEVQDDNARLGPAYDSFQVVTVAGMTKSELVAILRSKIPELQLVYKTTELPNQWSFVEPTRKMCWKSGAGWFGLEQRHKYPVNLILTSQDVTDLRNPIISVTDKTVIINKHEETISKNPLNRVEIIELRGRSPNG